MRLSELAPMRSDMRSIYIAPFIAAILLCGAVRAESVAQLEQKGIAALKISQTDGDAVVTAAVYFAQAIDVSEKAGDDDIADELNAYLYWCKKKLSPQQAETFAKGGDASLVEAAKRMKALDKPAKAEDVTRCFNRVSAFAKSHPAEHFLIAIQFFDIADRFKGSGLSLKAQDRSLQELTLASQAMAATPPTEKPASVAAGPKAPQPTPAQIKETEKTIRDIFKDDFGKSSAADKQNLSRKLEEQLADMKDDNVGRYVILHTITELATQLGDLDRFLAFRDKLDAAFELDIKEFSKAGFNTLMANTKDANVIKAIGALRTLADKPDDSAANLAVGKFTCFTQGNWDRGLPFLAKGSNVAWRDLAQQDIAAPTGAAQLLLADAWWDAAEKGEKDDKTPLQTRAAFWYRLSLPKVTGLAKVKVEKRLEAVAAASPAVATIPAIGTKPTNGATQPTKVLELKVDLGEGVSLELVLVPPGEFKMGAATDDTEAKSFERPMHFVTISKPFYIGKYPITVKQFKRFVDATKYRTDAEKAGKSDGLSGRKFDAINGLMWSKPGLDQKDNYPVVCISWNDSNAFNAWASQFTKRHFRLPSDAEWEYAARGPHSLKYPWGNEWDGTKANYADQSIATLIEEPDGEVSHENDGYAFTAPVGSFQNASWCGAFDMAGNVFQWVNDWHAHGYRASMPSVDPPGPTAGTPLKMKNGTSEMCHVMRGGSWHTIPYRLRSSYFFNKPPAGSSQSSSFRVVIVP
jgi:sulfatase modifying factor 1